MQKTVFSSGDVAAQVGIDRWRLIYLIESGQLPDASLCVPGRRLFTSADIARIREELTKTQGCDAAP